MGTVERMARGHVDCTTRGTRYYQTVGKRKEERAGR